MRIDQIKFHAKSAKRKEKTLQTKVTSPDLRDRSLFSKLDTSNPCFQHHTLKAVFSLKIALYLKKGIAETAHWI
jgi:hypothetical protein